MKCYHDGTLVSITRPVFPSLSLEFFHKITRMMDTDSIAAYHTLFMIIITSADEAYTPLEMEDPSMLASIPTEFFIF